MIEWTDWWYGRRMKRDPIDQAEADKVREEAEKEDGDE